MKTLFKVYTIGLNEPKDSVLLKTLTFTVSLSSSSELKRCPFRCFFQETKHMEITERYARAVGWIMPLPLKLGPFYVCDLGQVLCALSWSRTTPSVSRSCHLFLMDLRWLSIVSQYTSEVLVPLCSSNSRIVDHACRKTQWTTPCLLTF